MRERKGGNAKVKAKKTKEKLNEKKLVKWNRREQNKIKTNEVIKHREES